MNARMRLPQLTVLLSCLGLTVYFAHHSIYGRHGFEARTALMERASLLDFEIRSLEAVRSSLERDVALLEPELPDPDMVEEIARDTLGYVRPEDKVLLTPTP
jgi:cell division protein FtsB